MSDDAGIAQNLSRRMRLTAIMFAVSIRGRPHRDQLPPLPGRRLNLDRPVVLCASPRGSSRRSRPVGGRVRLCSGLNRRPLNQQGNHYVTAKGSTDRPATVAASFVGFAYTTTSVTHRVPNPAPIDRPAPVVRATPAIYPAIWSQMAWTRTKGRWPGGQPLSQHRAGNRQADRRAAIHRRDGSTPEPCNRARPGCGGRGSLGVDPLLGIPWTAASSAAANLPATTSS
jgi:hypothetical protein